MFALRIMKLKDEKKKLMWTLDELYVQTTPTMI
jgi:hypothetical protein